MKTSKGGVGYRMLTAEKIVSRREIAGRYRVNNK